MTKVSDSEREPVATARGESATEDVTKEIDLDLGSVTSPVLSRLIDEVKSEATVGRSYNRTYHRHNR